MLVYIALASMLILFCLCLVGVFYEGYDDNWLQRFGLSMVGIVSVVNADHLFHTGYVHFPELAMYVGVTLYGLGVAKKVWKFRKETSEQSHTIES